MTTNKIINNADLFYIIGSKKNSGKTTFLNYLLSKRREDIAPAYLTIGIDGESRDQIFDTPKPRIYAKVNDLLISSYSLLSANQGDLEIMHVFDFSTCLGRLVVARIVRNCYVELAGPDSNKQLKEIIEYLQNEQNVKEIYIDGAVNRVTQVAAVENAFFYHVSSIDPRNLNSRVNEIKKIHLLMEAAEHTPPEDAINVQGAFTQNKLQQLPDTARNLLLEDFSKVFLNYLELVAMLKNGYRIFFRNRYRLKAFVVNLYDISEDDFLKEIKEIKRDLIMFNPYMGK